MSPTPSRSSSPTTRSYLKQLAIAADRMFLVLAALLAASSLVLALVNHQWLPFLAVSLPALLVAGAQVMLASGTRLSRISMALVLVAIVAAMIQQSNGLVEMHFGVFVVLALLLYYRDWLPVVVAAAAVAVHHVTFYWLQSRGLPVTVFAPGSGFDIVLLHALYVVVEAGFVCVMAVQLRRQVDTLGASSSELMALVDATAAERAPVDPGTYVRGTLAHGITLMSAQIQQRREREDSLHHENAQIRASLDASRTGMMIADDKHIIRYVNDSVLSLLRNQQGELRKAFPDFNVDTLLGTSIHCFHQNPDRIRGLLDRLTERHQGAIRVGNAHFGQMVTPVFAKDGSRIGFVVEWHDRTEELKVEHDIGGIVAAAAEGDLSQRLDIRTSSPFIRTLSDGINQLLDTVSGATSEIRQMLAALAAGQLDRRVVGKYAGDFDAMKRDANRTAEQLDEIVGRIQSGVASITLSAGEISSGNEDLSRRTELQAANLEETAASMEELTSTVRQNADSARQANQLAINAASVAAQGGTVVDEVVVTMGEIEQSSRRIGEIISVIDGIAFQTNILALNAAVEAARAGEQGRGFAVVASEVRTLAQRSAAAAKEIKDLIDDSSQKVSSGAELVDRAGTTMRDIVASVERVTGIMQRIADASTEQSQSIEQVSQTVIHMDQSTQQNAALVEEASAAAHSMEEQAHRLGQAVAVFQRGHTTRAAVVA